MLNLLGRQLPRARHVVAATFALSVSLAACSGSDQDSDTIDDDSTVVELAEQATSDYWTDWTTDGSTPVQCQADQVMSGFGARGKYSDDIRIECSYFGFQTPGVTTSWWLPWISEEADRNEANCGPGAFITGVACSGKYCDNVSIRCTQHRDPVGDVERCERVGPFSEEKDYQRYFGFAKARAAYCKGKYCDDMEFDVCTYSHIHD